MLEKTAKDIRVGEVLALTKIAFDQAGYEVEPTYALMIAKIAADALPDEVMEDEVLAKIAEAEEALVTAINSGELDPDEITVEDIMEETDDAEDAGELTEDIVAAIEAGDISPEEVAAEAEEMGKQADAAFEALEKIAGLSNIFRRTKSNKVKDVFNKVKSRIFKDKKSGIKGFPSKVQNWGKSKNNLTNAKVLGIAGGTGLAGAGATALGMQAYKKNKR